MNFVINPQRSCSLCLFRPTPIRPLGFIDERHEAVATFQLGYKSLQSHSADQEEWLIRSPLLLGKTRRLIEIAGYYHHRWQGREDGMRFLAPDTLPAL